MITISEKDGATIIVIENPTGSEKRIIEQAKRPNEALPDSVWSKFACNKKKSAETHNELDEYVTILGEEDIPF